MLDEIKIKSHSAPLSIVCDFCGNGENIDFKKDQNKIYFFCKIHSEIEDKKC